MNFPLIILLHVACKSHHPQLPYKPKIYVGSAVEIGICRLVKKPYIKNKNDCFYYFKHPQEENTDVECIKGDCSEIEKFMAMRDADLGMLQKYIGTLIDSCKQWE
jgi:hypothetical protein